MLYIIVRVDLACEGEIGCVIPTDRIMAAAKERGMPEGDDSPPDWCEAEDCNLCKVASGFDLAVSIAREKLPVDFFGCVRIERMVKVREALV